MKRILCYLIFCCCFCQNAYSMCLPNTEANFTSSSEVVAISDKDLSNVILQFCDGTTEKFDNLSGLFATFSGTGDNAGKKITGVFIKSGCNGGESGGNGGQGEFHENPDADVCEETSCEDDEYQYQQGICRPVCELGYDECGICEGPGSSECGCNLDIVKDECGVCGGHNTSCQLQVCEVIDGDYDNAQVVTILEPDYDKDKHFPVDQCKPTTICLKHLEGPTVIVPLVAFYNKYNKLGALLGECQLIACVKSENGKFANVQFRLDSELETLIKEGKATKDVTKCDTVKVCVNPSGIPPTKQIPLFVLDWFTSRGFKEGNCPIEVCRLGIESENDATVIEIDPDDRLETDRNVADCEHLTICLDGQTITLPKFVATTYMVNEGATEGECAGECTITHEQCVNECTTSYDPMWVPKCVSFCTENCGIYCDKDKKDCIFDGLEPETCANANGFLGQVNIASVVNTSQEPLNVRIQYRDLFGVVQGQVVNTVETKWDVVVNDIGLAPDTYGTVCVQTDADEAGEWVGGVTLYKGIDGNGWGGPYEFALYYPFENFKIGFQTAALNTHNLGGSQTANWIRVTDAETDGHPLTGSLFIYRGDGTLAALHEVNIPDGGRFDFSGHDALGFNQVGTAILAPDLVNGKSPKFYFTSARYAYNCTNHPNGFGCNDFLTAFVVPNRAPIKGKTYNQVSTVEDMTVLELHNPIEKPITINVVVHNSTGSIVHVEQVDLNMYEVRHILMDGILNGDVGYASLNSDDYYIATTTFYTLENSIVGLGYSTPFTRLTPTSKQMTEFNSFLGQVNVIEITNTLTNVANGNMRVVDYLGNVISDTLLSIEANSTIRRELNIPADTYGIIAIDGIGLVVRNHVIKDNQYTLPFIGK